MGYDVWIWFFRNVIYNNILGSCNMADSLDSTAGKKKNESAPEILEKRYVKGEISKKQYQEIKKTLRR